MPLLRLIHETQRSAVKAAADVHNPVWRAPEMLSMARLRVRIAMIIAAKMPVARPKRGANRRLASKTATTRYMYATDAGDTTIAKQIVVMPSGTYTPHTMARKAGAGERSEPYNSNAPVALIANERASTPSLPAHAQAKINVRMIATIVNFTVF